jgi:hypothetical protein
LQSRLEAQSNNSESRQQPAADQPLAKKRKLENGQTAASVDAKDAPLQFYAQDISFAVPQRKKLTLEITAAGGYLRAKNQQSHNIEFGIALQDIGESPLIDSAGWRLGLTTMFSTTSRACSVPPSP